MMLADPYAEYQSARDYEAVHGPLPPLLPEWDQEESEFEAHVRRLAEVCGRPVRVRTDAAYSVDPETWLPSMSQLIERTVYAVRSIEGADTPRDVARAVVLKAIRDGAVPASPVAILAALVADGYAASGYYRYFLRALKDWGAVVAVPASVRFRPLGWFLRALPRPLAAKGA